MSSVEIAALIDQLLDREADISARHLAAVKLGWSGDLRAVDPLLEALSDDSPKVRAGAVLALGHLEASEAVTALLDHLKTDTSGHVRAVCAAELGFSVGPGEIDALVSALRDDDERVREMACSSLANLKSVKSVPEIVKLLKDPVWNVRLSACEALVSLEAVDDNVLRVIDELVASPEAEEYEEGLAAASEFFKAVMTDPSLASEWSMDGEPIDGDKQHWIAELASDFRKEMSPEDLPVAPPHPLQELADRARKVFSRSG